MGLHPSITNDPTGQLQPYLHIPGFTGTSAQRIAYSTSFSSYLTYSDQWADTDTGKTWQWGTTSAVGWQQISIGTSSMSVNPISITGGTSGQYLGQSSSNVPTWTSFTAPTIQKFLGGTSTYTTPISPKIPLYLKVKMVGGGAGGWGSGTAQGTTPSVGTSSSFGISAWAGGGAIAVAFNVAGGLGGTFSQGPYIGFGTTGGQGGGSGFSVGSATEIPGGMGGGSFFGGAGGAGYAAGPGSAGAANTGGGGGGAATGTTTNANSGPGGGAGGYVEVIIPNPTPTYTVIVGSGGGGGGNGPNGSLGASGGSGQVIVEEYYY